MLTLMYFYTIAMGKSANGPGSEPFHLTLSLSCNESNRVLGNLIVGCRYFCHNDDK